MSNPIDRFTQAIETASLPGSGVFARDAVLDATVLLRGPDGERSLSVADFIQGAFRTALAPGEILFAVEDTGPGIPPEHQAKVFSLDMMLEAMSIH